MSLIYFISTLIASIASLGYCIEAEEIGSVAAQLCESSNVIG